MSFRDSPPARLYTRVVQAALLPLLQRVFRHPDQVTIAGAATAVIAPPAFGLHPGLGLGVLLVSAVLDSLDGMLARKMGIASDFGAFLDSSLDRVGDFFYLASFWVLFAKLGQGLFGPSALAMAALLTTFLISYTKARAEGLGYECRAGFMGRAQRIVYLVLWAVVVILLPESRYAVLWIGLWLYFLLTLGTVAQRFVVIHRRMRLEGVGRRPEDE